MAGDWQCDVVHKADGVGLYTSLDIDGDDKPSIAYYDENNKHPWVAAYTGFGGNCGISFDWDCQRVDQSNKNTGKYISLYVEEGGQAHIAYYNETDGTLEYAEWVGSGGNCGEDEVFSIME